MDYFGLAFNVHTTGPTQYANYDFNSFCVFNGVPLGADGVNGIMSLGDSDTDDGTAVDAFFDLKPFISRGRLHSMYTSGEFDGLLMVSIKNEEGNERWRTIEPPKIQVHQVIRTKIGRDARGSAWRMRIKNQQGSDFSIDQIDVYPIRMSGGSNLGP